MKSLYLTYLALPLLTWRYRRALRKLSLEQREELVASSVAAGNSTVENPSSRLADAIFVAQQLSMSALVIGCVASTLIQ